MSDTRKFKSVETIIFFIILFSDLTFIHAETPPEQTPALLSKGKALYLKTCSSCHGDKGMGDGAAASGLNPKPRNFISDKFKEGTSPNQIFNTISKGIHGSQMASFSSLPSMDRWALTFYVSSLRKTKEK